ncbi:MAG TPA: hypothetical protein VEG39_08885 [Clostridia bacterium]|nr:hypothetical protein [Clostridia bacterium]
MYSSKYDRIKGRWSGKTWAEAGINMPLQLCRQETYICIERGDSSSVCFACGFNKNGFYLISASRNRSIVVIVV